MTTKEMIEKYIGESYPNLLTPEMADKFSLLLDELKGWNEKFNLTSITDDRDIIIKHFVDSLVLVKPNKSMTWQTIVDIGAGAGFPGIPLAIAFPGKKIFLNESNGKKVTFLLHIKDSLNLRNMEILEGRAETLSHTGEFREFFDAACMRALASFSIGLELSASFVKPGGAVMYYASAKQAAEINKDMPCFKELGCVFDGMHHYELPEGCGSHTIVSVNKMWKTPAIYPRVYGSIKKKPL